MPAVRFIPFEHVTEDSITAHDSETPLQLPSKPTGNMKSTTTPHKAFENMNMIVLESTQTVEDTNVQHHTGVQSINQQQSLTITESISEEGVVPITEKPHAVEKPRQQILQQNAVQTMTSMSLCKEEKIADFGRPIEGHATPILDISQEIIISDTVNYDTHTNLPSFSMDNVRNASPNIVSSTHLTITENNLEELTKKYYPELIVATETANQNFNPLHEYITEQPMVTENEQNLDQKPSDLQQAQIDIIPQSYMIQHSDVPIENLNPLEAPDVNAHIAKQVIMENISRAEFETTIMESETNFINAKKSQCDATDSVQTMQVATTNQLFINESEKDRPLDEKKSATAKLTMDQANITIEQSNLIALETTDSYTYPIPHERNAIMAPQPAFAKQIEEIAPYENTENNKKFSIKPQTADYTDVESLATAEKSQEIIKTGKQITPFLIFNTHLTILYHKQTKHTTLQHNIQTLPP